MGLAAGQARLLTITGRKSDCEFESMPLSYGILMTPSTLNDYMPTTITDTLGRVVLNNQYAAAARAAGIPQEGLGTLPSEAMRNAFILGLQAKGVITNTLANTILGLPYNQEAGIGGGTTSMIILPKVLQSAA